MTADQIRPPGFVKTKPRGIRPNPVTDYSALLHVIRDAGLLRRRAGFYLVVFAVISVALAALAVGAIILNESWFVLLIAAGMGVIFTQFAFLAHEASHRQIFQSGKANDAAARTIANLIVGISYSWWMTKHSRHHANPNALGKDPDIAPGVVSFVEADASNATALHGWFTRRQGYLFFPILILEGLNLYVSGFRTVFGHGRVDKRLLEMLMLIFRNSVYLALVFLLLSPGMGAAFIGVQLAVFGIYMGASFAPNHKGMPILAKDSKVDFLRRQVLTSRNITGGKFVTTFMGGLNFQVEHHLFPNMPRPNLKRAQLIAKRYCLEHDIVYTETTMLKSYAIVVRHLNRVGLAADGDPFDCPASAAFGR